MEAAGHFDAWSGRVDEAAAWAARLHRGQDRAMTDVPYITHLWAVAALVAEWGGDEDQVVAAFLHEAARDDDGTMDLDEIDRRFGPRAAGIVADCSTTPGATNGPQLAWEDRVTARLGRLGCAPVEARLVACCDALHDATSIVRALRRCGWRSLERLPGGPDGVLWSFRGLAGLFRSTGGLPPELVRELERAVAEMAVLGKVDGSLTPLSGESLDEWSGRVASVARRVRMNGRGLRDEPAP